MRIEGLPLRDLRLVHLDRNIDERGFFARTFSRNVFAEQGLADCSLECSLSHNRSAGTLRGMHFQRHPHGETKLVRCTRGAIFDVAVDVRPGSASFGCWFGIELSADNSLALYIPAGFAHGFVTLHDNSDVFYQIAEPFVPSVSSGFRWNDPAVAIEWPFSPRLLSARDEALPLLAALELA